MTAASSVTADPGTMTRALAAILAATALMACASTPGGAAQELAGCWYFEQDATARDLNLPWGVRLTADSLTGWPGVHERPGTRTAITLVRPGETAGFPFGYWRALPGDSVRIGYPGMGGFALDLVVSDGALTGQARPVGDAGLGERRPSPVRLARAGCPDA